MLAKHPLDPLIVELELEHVDKEEHNMRKKEG